MTAPGRDPGLQPERTRLAWRRTTLSCTVVALLAGRQVLHGGVSGAGVAALALTVPAWLLFLGVAHRRIAGTATAEPAPLSPRLAVTAAACAAALAVCAAAMLF
ncbi:DUF202 domain-containing protein [Streptomyces sp. NPDC005899]|uniref:DUF202 domain-containing protein n=1 Tax=Streptomyces sp. NPDC005899 TaxID=3155716 RepID=UPI00340A4FD0